MTNKHIIYDSHGDNDDTIGDFLFAIHENDFSAVKSHLESGHDPFEQSLRGVGALDYAISSRSLDILQIVVQYQKAAGGCRPVSRLRLHHALSCPLDFFSFLFDLVPDANVVNETGRPLLSQSIVCDASPQVISFLLEKGADPGGRRPPNLDTPLHDACSHGDTKAVHLLIRFGADPSLLNGTGESPLRLAVNSYTLSGDSEALTIIRYLQERKAPILPPLTFRERLVLRFPFLKSKPLTY